MAPGVTLLGVVHAREALSLAPGGRRRMRRAGESPSRAAMKLEEALDRMPFEPSRGDVCVDLGAAPGGWTQRLVSRGAKVIAVDPARLMPELASNPRVRHVQESAFAFAPDEPVDWLFCDMAWRPLEVAQLLAKWGRRGWASHLVANIKLPMKDKNPILLRVRHTLTEDGGWKGLTVRQLYHDRDEVTVTAHRR
jgi:23S rRNA (cytidine2498-2'-O)-methyltransferase